MNKAAPPPSPIACRMDALTPAERTRRSEVLALLTRRTVEVVETADGMAFHLRNDPDTTALAGEGGDLRDKLIICQLLGIVHQHERLVSREMDRIGPARR